MNRKSQWALRWAAMGVGLFSGVICSVALAADPATQPDSNSQLSDKVKELRAEVNQLKQQQAAATAAVATPVPVSTTTTAPAGGFMSGFSMDRFTIQSADGNFVLRPWLHLQLRDVTTIRQDFKFGPEDDVQNGFELRRLKLGFDGNLFTPNLTYNIDWATSRANGTSTVTNAGKVVGTVSNSTGGTPILEEAWFKYVIPHTSFYIKSGQIKDPIYHEQWISSRYQQSTERSITSDMFFNGDAFTEAVTVGFDPKSWFRAEAGVDHGLRAANTNFLDYPNTNAFNYGVVGRAEFKIMGRWQDYLMGASGVKEPLLIIGIGSEYSERGHAGQTVGAIDAMYADPCGVSLFGSISDRYTNHNFGIASPSATGASITAAPAGVADTATNEYSFLIQTGYLIDQHVEPFGRFEYMHLAGTAAGSHTYIPAITAGVNYYFAGHRCKLTGQATYLPNGFPIDETSNDILASPNKHGEISVVAQFQLLL